MLRRIAPDDLPFLTRIHALPEVAQHLYPGGRPRSPEETADTRGARRAWRLASVSSIRTPCSLNDLTPQLRDLAERILLAHAGPLNAEDEVVHSEHAGVPVDVVSTFLRIAEDESVAREILERASSARRPALPTMCRRAPNVTAQSGISPAGSA